MENRRDCGIIPKKPNPAFLNDYRPIGLRSLLMKSFQKIVLKCMLPQVEHLLDPLLFAYRSERSTLSMLNVERPGSYARMLFVDFCRQHLIQSSHIW